MCVYSHWYVAPQALLLVAVERGSVPPTYRGLGFGDLKYFDFIFSVAYMFLTGPFLPGTFASPLRASF